jgi:hypothetical protein
MESSIRSRQNAYVLNFLIKNQRKLFTKTHQILFYLEHRIVECRHAASVQVRNTFPIERVKSRNLDIEENKIIKFIIIPASTIFLAASSTVHILPNNRKHRFVISI